MKKRKRLPCALDPLPDALVYVIAHFAGSLAANNLSFLCKRFYRLSQSKEYPTTFARAKPTVPYDEDVFKGACRWHVSNTFPMPRIPEDSYCLNASELQIANAHGFRWDDETRRSYPNVAMLYAMTFKPNECVFPSPVHIERPIPMLLASMPTRNGTHTNPVLCNAFVERVFVNHLTDREHGSYPGVPACRCLHLYYASEDPKWPVGPDLPRSIVNAAQSCAWKWLESEGKHVSWHRTRVTIHAHPVERDIVRVLMAMLVLANPKDPRGNLYPPSKVRLLVDNLGAYMGMRVLSVRVPHCCANVDGFTLVLDKDTRTLHPLRVEPMDKTGMHFHVTLPPFARQGSAKRQINS